MREMIAVSVVIACVMLVGCIVGIVGEIVAGHWISAVMASFPTGIFLTLVIIISAEVVRKP